MPSSSKWPVGRLCTWMPLNVPEQRTTDWWWQAGLSNQNCFRIFSNYCKTIYILSAHYLVLGKLYEHSHLTKPKYMLPWQLCTPYKYTRFEPTASKQLMAWNPKDTSGKSQTWWPSTASSFFSSRLDHIFPLDPSNSGRVSEADGTAKHFLASIQF